MFTLAWEQSQWPSMAASDRPIVSIAHQNVYKPCEKPLGCDNGQSRPAA